jgi:DNA polymerase-3 subunit chi
MGEVLFYQLERRPLEKVLPELLAKSLERGWRVVVEAGSDERLEALNGLLWTYDDTSFLPHGTAADGNAADQPIYLTVGPDNPNGAVVRFLVDGATTRSFSDYQRIVFLFDAGDPDAMASAREAWKAAKADATDATYWRQDEGGRWRKEA